MSDDITIGVTEIVNNIEVTAQPNDQIIDISVTDNADNVTLNITPTVIEINVNKGSSYAKWGDIYGTLSDQTDLQNALNLKANLVGGKVPASELPSYVDDIIEVANYAALPATGEIGKIYVTLDNNKIYRWSGSIYIEIASNSAIWGAITGTLSSQTDLVNALNLRVPYTGATSNVNLGEYGLTSGFLGLDTTPTSTPTGIGTIYWDSANRTAALIDGDGDTTLQIGQEQRILVHNNTGSTLTDGQVVYVTGSTGNVPSVSLANASSETTSAATLGVVTESIANGADGFITTSGIVNGLNTLAFNEGELLWLGTTAGTFTATKPISPNHLVLIGYVIKKAGGNGSILVKIQNTQELEESSDVLFTSLANNQVLTYESATDLWKNKSIATILGYTPANDASVVHLAGTETITGVKTFSVDTIINGVTVGKGGASEVGNTAVGQNALSSNTSGILNTAIGFESLLNNTGGGDNTSLGWWSLKSNTTGNSNVSAGTASLANNTTGFGNTSLGWNSLAVSTTGAFNSALGYLAGSSFGGSDSNANTLTSYSIYIGYKAGPLANSQTNQIVIGKNAIGAGSNTVTIGNTDITTTRLRGEIQGGSFKKDGGTSSQFLKADGSVDSTTYQTALTNPVTGTGTTNYLPKFTGTSALGNSLIYDNGTNVGIGTASPSALLNVVGASDMSGTFETTGTNNAASLILKSGNGTTSGLYSYLRFINNNTNQQDWRIGTYGNNNFSFVNSKALSTPMILTTNGELLIGRTSSYGAGWQLAVEGNIYAKNDLRIDANASFGGNVGIGTTSPSSLLHLYVPTGTLYQTLESNVINQTVGTITKTPSKSFFTGQNYSVTNNWEVYDITSSASRLSISPTGNVGIGTTSPSFPLHLYKASSDVLLALQKGANLGYVFCDGTNIGLASDLGSSGYKFLVNRSAPDNAMIINGSGNVGIGTTSPSEKLQVVGNAFIGGSVEGYTSGLSGYRTYTKAAQFEISSYQSVGGSPYTKTMDIVSNADSGVPSEMRFLTADSGANPAERMRITSGGLVFMPFVYSNPSGAAANVGISATGELFRSASSLKYKKNVENYSKGLNEIMQMRPVTYNSINENEEGIKYAGLIAEEIHDLGLTEFVQYAEDGTPDALSYANMVSLLVKGIQELKAEIEILKNK